MPEFQQCLFVCPNCTRDTLTQPHHYDCPVYKREASRQTALKMRELGMKPAERFGPPLYDP